MTDQILTAQRRHLANLLEAIQRCLYFLQASRVKLHWPLHAEELARRDKDVSLFETLAALNERFGKLQDTLGAAMRHAFLLAGESGDTFLKVLAFHEKIGVLERATDWQLCRTVRNLAAHAYETDYVAIAEHFNTLNDLTPLLYGIAARFIDYCHDALTIQPLSDRFTNDCQAITRQAALPTNGQNPIVKD
jgi:hypothetical protein